MIRKKIHIHKPNLLHNEKKKVKVFDLSLTLLCQAELSEKCNKNNNNNNKNILKV